MAPAGVGNSASRIANNNANVNPPPAESPAITIFLGSTGSNSSCSGGSIK